MVLQNIFKILQNFAAKLYNFTANSVNIINFIELDCKIRVNIFGTYKRRLCCKIRVPYVCMNLQNMCSICLYDSSSISGLKLGITIKYELMN